MTALELGERNRAGRRRGDNNRGDISLDKEDCGPYINKNPGDKYR